ncbi:MAG: hypothetical protein GY896_22910 [Gammaproteobacteria bacterium]|nr:hypothetical protein [Gammaproteobacteria bacterium]
MSSTPPPLSTFNYFGEIGYSGLKVFSGRIEDSTLRQLRGPRRAERLRMMAETDDIVGGILLAYETLGRSAPWRVEQGDSDEEQADFLQSCIEDLNRDWSDILSSAFTFMPYGYAPHEVVYKRRLGEEPGEGEKGNSLPSSKFNDGRIGWHKWALRAQTSISRWEFDENGDAIGMWQRIESTDVKPKASGSSVVGAEVPIPMKKILLFRTTGQKNSPEGRTLLETAFKQWFIKNHLIEVEAVGAERDLVGYPIIYAASDVNIWGEDSKEVASFNRAMEIATGMRRDELMGAVFPDGWKVELIRSGGAQAVDLDKLIKAKNQGIAISMMGDFVLIGHEGTGSYALRESADNFFLRALNGILDILASAMNRQEVPRLMKLNNFKPPYPMIMHGDPDAPDLDNMLKTVKELREGGSEVVFDDEIIRALLERARLPIPSSFGEPVMGRETRWSPGARGGGPKPARQFYDGVNLGAQPSRDVGRNRTEKLKNFLGLGIQ